MIRRWPASGSLVSPRTDQRVRRPEAAVAIQPDGKRPAERFGASAEVAGPSRPLAISVLLIVTAAMCYNAVLAIVNAHGPAMSPTTVGITEMLVLTSTAALILRTGRRSIDSLGFLILILFLIDALIVSIASETPYVTMARNGAIIALFLMLGARIDLVTLKRIFMLCAILVFVFLLLEMVNVKAYASLLSPSLYYERTRGTTPFEFDELGLFPNAIGFAGRFSISSLSDHRTSSLFLEQVSLANFSTVLVIYLTAMWQRLSLRPKIFYIVLIVLILLTTNSRTGLFLALIAPPVYFLAPRLNRLTPLAIMPGILAAAALAASTLAISYDDTFSGRVQLTMRNLAAADMPALLGSSAPLAVQFSDSGIVFLIYSMSLAGFLAFWVMVSLVLSGSGAAPRRCALLMGLYMFCNLLVSGNAIFTIKVAALQWVLVGFLRREETAASSPSLGRSVITGVGARLSRAA